MVTIKVKPKYPRQILRHPFLQGTFIGFIIASGIFSILTIEKIWGMFLFAYGLVLFTAIYMNGGKNE